MRVPTQHSRSLALISIVALGITRELFQFFLVVLQFLKFPALELLESGIESLDELVPGWCYVGEDAFEEVRGRLDAELEHVACQLLRIGQIADICYTARDIAGVETNERVLRASIASNGEELGRVKSKCRTVDRKERDVV